MEHLERESLILPIRPGYALEAVLLRKGQVARRRPLGAFADTVDLWVIHPNGKTPGASPSVELVLSGFYRAETNAGLELLGDLVLPPRGLAALRTWLESRLGLGSLAPLGPRSRLSALADIRPAT
jgi:hypothetical protein